MYCFDKTRRLLKKADYDHVFQQAKRISSSGIIVLYRNNSMGYSRLGMAIAKKSIPKAHDRNRLKRLVRETFRTKEQLPAVDIIILAKPGVMRDKTLMLNSELDNLWNKLIKFYVK